MYPLPLPIWGSYMTAITQTARLLVNLFRRPFLMVDQHRRARRRQRARHQSIGFGFGFAQVQHEQF